MVGIGLIVIGCSGVVIGTLYVLFSDAINLPVAIFVPLATSLTLVLLAHRVRFLRRQRAERF